MRAARRPLFETTRQAARERIDHVVDGATDSKHRSRHSGQTAARSGEAPGRGHGERPVARGRAMPPPLIDPTHNSTNQGHRGDKRGLLARATLRDRTDRRDLHVSRTRHDRPRAGAGTRGGPWSITRRPRSIARTPGGRCAPTEGSFDLYPMSDMCRQRIKSTFKDIVRARSHAAGVCRRRFAVSGRSDRASSGIDRGGR
jgi:hypothetical protein